MVIFEGDYYAHVWSELEERLGVSMADTMIRGQNAAAQDYLENHIIFGWRKFALQHLPMDLMFRRIVGEVALFGFGSLDLLEYKPGKLMVMKVKHPFDIISLAWGVKGLVEFADGSGSELAWKKEGDDYVLSVNFHPRGPEEIDKEALRFMRDAKRELSLVGKLLPPQEDRGEPCASCGTPRILTELEWRESEGTICRRDSDRRFIFTSGHIFLAIVRDLEKQTGQSLDKLITDISKDYHLRVLQGIRINTRNGAYRAAAKYLFAGGFGNVQAFNCGEGYLDMTIGNPFYLPRLVGRIAGLFEYVEDVEAKIGYRSTGPQILELEIRAA